MKRYNNLLRGIHFIVILALLSLPMQVVHGQAAQTITATGTVTRPDDNSTTLPLTLTFPPAGGEVNGRVYQTYDNENADGSICAAILEWNLTGTFTGGDGGTASGPLTGTLSGPGCTDHFPVYTYSGSWSGNFYNEGNGSGVYEATISAEGQTATGQFTWEVSYAPEAFASGLESAITAETIYATYGIKVADSLPGDQYGQKSWSQHELALLNEVLSGLPQELLQSMELNRIVRSQEDLDASGNPKPTVAGFYLVCDQTDDPGCTGTNATIRIFDTATTTYDYPNDPSGDTDFKATILHEMIHAMQHYKDEYTTYPNAYISPLVQNYMNATRPDTSAGAGIQHNGWGWYGAKGWHLYTSADSLPPTQYGQTSPLEDMCELVKMYCV